MREHEKDDRRYCVLHQVVDCKQRVEPQKSKGIRETDRGGLKHVHFTVPVGRTLQQKLAFCAKELHGVQLGTIAARTRFVECDKSCEQKCGFHGNETDVADGGMFLIGAAECDPQKDCMDQSCPENNEKIECINGYKKACTPEPNLKFSFIAPTASV